MFVILILSAFLVLFAAWFLTRPVRGRVAAEEGRIALELTRDEALRQLKEIESDRNDGRIDEVIAREETQRLEYELARILHSLESPSATVASASRAISHRGRVALMFLVILPVLAGGMDYWMNKPALLTFAALNAKGRMTGVHGMPPMVLSMVAKLRRHLAKHPNDTGGWLELARANVVLGNLKGARSAYAQAYRLAPDDVNVLANYAWLLYTSHPTKTVGLVDTLYRRLYARDPKQQDALWFLGLAAYNRGHFHRTLSYWQRLEAELPPGSKARTGVETAVGDIQKRLGQPAVKSAPAGVPKPQAGASPKSQVTAP
ncbi:MAG: TPR domain-containing protein [Acidiferrobacter sp.]